jgi:site-specific recombinase XerD
MGQLRDKMAADLKIGGYSKSTQNAYLCYARKFAVHHMRSPDEMGADEIRTFMIYLIEEQKISRSTVRQVRSALRFLYTVTLNRPIEIEWLPSPRRQKRLPQVLSGTEVTAFLAAVERSKYRMIFSCMYSAGLRIGEAVAIQLTDIDSKRMVLRVRGKGDKERTTLLSQRLLFELRDYWRQTRPKGEWLFPGRNGAGHVSTCNVRKIFHLAKKAAGITKPVTPHVLRHSFATHLIDTGVDVTVVQSLLGHYQISTTSKYTHTTVQRISRTRSPLDLLGSIDAAVLG